HPCLEYIVGKRLLHIYMLTELHCRQSLYGMVVVGRRYGHRIDMAVLFIEHLAVIFVILGFGEPFHRSGSPAIVHITEVGYLCLAAFMKVSDIRFAFTTHADTCHDQPIAGGNETRAAQHMPRHHHKTSSCRSSGFDKIPSAGTYC